MAQIPDRATILDWIAQNPTQTAKRDIARAFGIKGADRIELKRVLRAMEDDGLLARKRRTYRDPDALPPVCILEVAGPDADGDLLARPLEWTGDGPEPRILLITRRADPALGAGDRILARVAKVTGDGHHFEGRLIRRIGTTARRMLGVFRAGAEGGRILPVDKKQDREWAVAPGNTQGARDGELVEAEPAGPRGGLGLPRARVVARLGDPSAPRAVSLIAIHQHGIPDAFPEDALAEAVAAIPAAPEGRTDLRDLPLVTIDPPDARDHDDAVCAAPDDDPGNPGGHVLWVAIADVAHHVPPGSALDREARSRGNSTYFPDRVVPMLPEALSGDLCSLHEGADRACVAVRMVLDAEGEKLSHRFVRGMMRSAGSLTYAQVQAARDGNGCGRAAELAGDVIAPLYAAFAAMEAARARRAPLELDLPERRIVLGEDGRVASVALAERLDAHRLIEACMVQANVAAAQELALRRIPLLYRVHEEPTPEKMEALRDVAQASGLTLAKGQVLHTRALNRLLAQAQDSDVDDLVNLATLRSMQQAYYAAQNFGHFGLALREYAHFTSPIRRYADLIVHRALIAAHGWGDDGLAGHEVERLEDTAKHISSTERRSMAAERDTTDRYLAAYLSDRVGTELPGRISGIQRFGAFVKLDETGADGLVPVRSIGAEYFVHDPRTQTLMGADSGLTLGVGQRVLTRLVEAVPVTGGLMLELLEIEGQTLAKGPVVARGAGPRGRKVTRASAKAAKVRRKVERTRK